MSHKFYVRYSRMPLTILWTVLWFFWTKKRLTIASRMTTLMLSLTGLAFLRNFDMPLLPLMPTLRPIYWMTDSRLVQFRLLAVSVKGTRSLLCCSTWLSNLFWPPCECAYMALLLIGVDSMIVPLLTTLVLVLSPSMVLASSTLWSNTVQFQMPPSITGNQFTFHCPLRLLSPHGLLHSVFVSM